MSERRKSGGSRRTSGTRKINRAQKKAMEVRSAESVVSDQIVEAPVQLAAEAPTRRPTRARRRSGQAAAKPALLSRAQEYAYIRSDFRRLLITGGSLLAVMLVLLVIID
jgi:hypothetical protein